MQGFNSNEYIKIPFWIILIAGIACINFSCKKFVEVAPPQTEIEGVTVFSDNDAALSAALGVYASMQVSNLNICSGGMTVYPALTSDELIYTSTNAELLSFQNNSIIANNGTGIYSRLWVPAYKTIFYANSVLEGVISSKKISDSIRDQIEGEMLVVRALNYFCLTNLFGDIPLELTTDYRINSVMSRTSVVQIYDQLVTDLLKAKDLLKEDYPSSSRARPNKWAAAALLARIYLYKKDWVNAELQCASVINSNQYSLESDLQNVFSQSSNETIWQLANDNSNTSEGASFVPSSATSRPSYAITDFLLSAFEDGDLRKTDWIGTNIVRGTTYSFPYKYKIKAFTPVTEYYVVLRLAEQYLIRAEARAQQGNIEGAQSDIDLIRGRAGLMSVTAGTKDSLLSEILHERQVELFCEWGQRWCDLKRTGLADVILGERKKPGWQSTDSLYPLPANEILRNPVLIQNPGY